MGFFRVKIRSVNCERKMFLYICQLVFVSDFLSISVVFVARVVTIDVVINSELFCVAVRHCVVLSCVNYRITHGESRGGAQ